MRYGSPNQVGPAGKMVRVSVKSVRLASEHPAAGDVSLWARSLAECS